MSKERSPMNIRLRDLRKSQGKSAQQVALATGISKNGIHILETNPNNSPMVRTLVILADYYGVSLDYLSGRTDNPEISPKKEDCETNDNPRPHGRWVQNGKCNHKPYRLRNADKWVVYKCSVCGFSNGRRFNDKFCPNCGAIMDEEEDHGRID